MAVELPQTHLDLLDEPIVVMLATLNPDGQPQVTPVWCSRAGQQVWVNTAKGRRKDKNMRERPQATVAVLDPTNPYRWLEVRGRVVDVVEGEAAHAHIEALSQHYFGRMFNMAEGEQRVLFKIEPTAVSKGG